MDAELEPDLAKELEKGGGGGAPSGGQPPEGGQPVAGGQPATQPQARAGSQAPPTQQLLGQARLGASAAKILLDTGEPLPSAPQQQEGAQAGGQQPSGKVEQQPSRQGRGSAGGSPRRPTVVPEWELQERAEEEGRREEEARRELERLRDRGREILVAFDTAVAQLEERLRREGRCLPPSITRLREMIDERARELVRAHPWLTFDWARMVAAAELADKGILKLDEVKRQLTVESPVQYRAVALIRGQPVELPADWDRWDEKRRAEWLHDLLKRWGADSAVIAVASRDAFGNVKVERQLSTVTLQQLEEYLHPKQTFYVRVLPKEGAETRMEVPPFEEWVKRHPEYAGLPEDVQKQYYSLWIMVEAASRGYSKIWTGSGWMDIPRDLRVTALQVWTPEGAKWVPVQVFSEWKRRAEGSGGFLGGAAAGLLESLSFGLLQPPWRPPAPAAQIGGEVVPLYWRPQGVQYGTKTAVGSREVEAAERTGLAEYGAFRAGEAVGQQAGEWLKAYAFGKAAQIIVGKLLEAPPIEQILEKVRAGGKLGFWERLKYEAWLHLPQSVYEKLPEVAKKLGLVEERYRMPEEVEVRALRYAEGGEGLQGYIGTVKVAGWRDIPPELADFIEKHAAEVGAFPVKIGGKTVWVPWASRNAVVVAAGPGAKGMIIGFGGETGIIAAGKGVGTAAELAPLYARGVVDVDAIKAALMGGVPLQPQQLLTPQLGPAFLAPSIPVATSLAAGGAPIVLAAGSLALSRALLDLPQPAAILGSVRLEGLGDLPALINASKGGATLTLDAPLPSGGSAPLVVRVEGGRAEAEVYAPKGAEREAAETGRAVFEKVSKELGAEPGEVKVRVTVPLVRDEKVKEVVLIPLEGELRDEVEKLLEKKGIDRSRWPHSVIFVPTKPERGGGFIFVPIPGLAGWTWIRTPFGEVPGVELAPGVIAVPVTAPIVTPAISTIQAQQLRLDLQTGQVCCPPPTSFIFPPLPPIQPPGLPGGGALPGSAAAGQARQLERLRI